MLDPVSFVIFPNLNKVEVEVEVWLIFSEQYLLLSDFTLGNIMILISFPSIMPMSK